jgi:hypothetical protein
MKTTRFLFLLAACCVSLTRLGFAESPAQVRRGVLPAKAAPVSAARVLPKPVHEAEALRVSKINSPVPAARTTAIPGRNPGPAGISGSMIHNARNATAVNGTGIRSRTPKQ